jgi:precorrin-6B methylase 2
MCHKNEVCGNSQLYTVSSHGKWHNEVGGELIRVAVQRAAPIGGFLDWKPMVPVTQWVVVK